MEKDFKLSIDLPKSWVKATISEMIAANGVFVDGDWIESKDQDPNGEVRLIQLADIGDGDFRNKSSRFLTLKRANEIGCTFLLEGDVLVARMPDPIGRACIFPLKGANKFVTAVDVAIIRTGLNGVNSKLLTYFINCPVIRNKIEALQSGTTRKRISRGNLSLIEFPIPPFKEQNRIVEKLDELLSELEKGKEQLQTSLEQLKVYRQSILKNAFEGKLTNDESDHQKITFHSIIKLISGSTPKGIEKATNQGTIPFYRVSDMNLKGNEVEMLSSAILLSEKEKQKLKIKTYPKGTVIFPKRGGAIFTNKKRILGEDASFDLNLMGALPNERVNSKYLFYWFILLDLSKICDGSNVPQINYKNFDSVEFDFFEPDIQLRIVDAIELQLSNCDEMESSILNNLAQTDSLRSITLQKAFEGKLAEQNPADEPASILLERIKMEREEYLKKEKERKKTEKPLQTKARKMAEELKRIMEILKESKEPISAKTLWQSSTHKDDIDDFYAALKKHIEAGEIIELPRKGKESFLKLAVTK